jgi:hypothetical protein
VIALRTRNEQYLVVNQSGGEDQRLPNIFVLKFRVLSPEFSTVWIDGQRLKHSADGKTEFADTRPAVHPSYVNRDSVESLHRRFGRFLTGSGKRPELRERVQW